MHIIFTVNCYSIYAWDEYLLSSKCCESVKNSFGGIRLLQTHLQYVCNIHVIEKQ